LANKQRNRNKLTDRHEKDHHIRRLGRNRHEVSNKRLSGLSTNGRRKRPFHISYTGLHSSSLKTIKGDVLDLSSFADAMAGQDAVISALGSRGIKLPGFIQKASRISLAPCPGTT